MQRYLQNKKICVITDSDALLLEIKEILLEQDSQAFLFTSPYKALEEIETIHPDVIILDITIPGIKGIDIINATRTKSQVCKDTPILILTPQSDTDLVTQSLLAGADGFCTKIQARDLLCISIYALIRSQIKYEELLRYRQNITMKSIIGTYKHEFNNILAILYGKMRKIEKIFPETKGHESCVSVLNNLARFEETLKTLDKLQEYKEESYANESSILQLKEKNEKK